MKTVRFLKNCTLEIGVNEFGRCSAPPGADSPEEPITQLGSYWCDVTVNGLDTVRVPLSVQPFAEPKSSSQRLRLAQKEPEPAEREVGKP
ncbi:hypothetical protein E2320_014051 [Naja naja]|nr:hypothetical protein E2320_014051 [Naja naja]